MERKAVASGAIRSVGYQEQSQTLEIEFQTGRVYQYAEVPPAVYAWLLRVENKGGFVNRMIIPRFVAREVAGPADPPAVDLETALRTSLAQTETPVSPSPDDEG